MKKLAVLACLAAALSASAEVIIGNGDRIAFLGDSITANGNRPAGYVNMVMKGLELSGVKAEKIAVGVSGNKSNDMLARLEKDVISRKAKWMTISCGVNDVWHGARGVELEDYKVNIGKILDACAAADIKVIVLTATMIREDASNKENQKLAGYNDWLRSEAKRRGLPLADLNADMQAELARIREADKTPGNKLTVDGVHMAFPGDCMMAWGVLRAMGVDEAKKDEIYAAWRKMPEAWKYEIKITDEENARLLKAGICPGDLARRALDAMDGWKSVKWRRSAFEDGVWKMGVDGVMTATKDDAIWSEASYENFELDFDYKLDHGANSGVIIYAEDTKNWIPNAIEIQLLDDNNARWKNDAPELKNGSLYGHVAPTAFPAKGGAQWNHMTIKAVGQQITVTVNGQLALDYSLAKLTDGKVAPSGFKIPGHLPRPWSTIRTSGPIGFQGMHGGALPYFRNVRIRPVP